MLFTYIFKEILVHDKKFIAYIEDHNIYWIDDVPLINTFFLRLIKNLNTEKEFNSNYTSTPQKYKLFMV